MRHHSASYQARPLCPAGHLPHKGGDRPGAGLLPSRRRRPGLRPPVPLSLSLAQAKPERTGRLRLPRKSKKSDDTRRRPVRRFLPRDFGLSAAPALAGDFSRGARLLTGGRPHTLDNPVLPPCHATQALPARCQGRQGFGPSKAFTLAPTSPGGDHFPRTPGKGSRVLPLPPAPAPPRHNALWCIRDGTGSV
jgi:hypothetical protein